jgi:RHS repeat-associated protein
MPIIPGSIRPIGDNKEDALHYNGFRDYLPGVGRYIEADPSGLRGGLNVYAYAGGQPLTATDRHGLDSSSAPGSVTSITVCEGIVCTGASAATTNGNTSTYFNIGVQVPASPVSASTVYSNNPTGLATGLSGQAGAENGVGAATPDISSYGGGVQSGFVPSISVSVGIPDPFPDTGPGANVNEIPNISDFLNR